MIHVKRVYGVLIRHLATLRNPFELVNYFYWTMIDVLIFGFMGLAMKYAKPTTCAQESSTTFILLTNVVLWYIVARGLNGIGHTLGRDLRDANFIATFATPLKLSEWICAALAMGSVASLINFTTGIIMVKLFFGLNILNLGFALFVACLLLLICSWILGLFVTSLLIYWGKRVESMLWVIGWIFVPFSGVYYPLDVLPKVAQAVGNCVPMYHVFAGMREAVTGCANPYPHFLTAALIAIPLFVAVLILFVCMFRASKRRGLSRLEVEA